jgi:hypothetical protein
LEARHWYPVAQVADPEQSVVQIKAVVPWSARQAGADVPQLASEPHSEP